MKEDVGVETISPQRWHLVGVSTEITDRKTAEAERERMLLEADAAAVQQRAFLRDVLFSVTDGRLCLCAGADDLPPRLDNAQPPVSLTMYGGLRDLRRAAEQTAAAREFPKERRYDLITAASEAGMNAIIHAGGGTGEVRNDGRERVQVWISDTGAGIAVEQLPRATLARGYSTAATLGHGMKMMIQMVDRIFLLTGPDGTTVVLEQDRRAPSDGGLVF
jgi:anti-sigma regulatory factor (Ser/Thr protein kinase)